MTARTAVLHALSHLDESDAVGEARAALSDEAPDPESGSVDSALHAVVEALEAGADAAAVAAEIKKTAAAAPRDDAGSDVAIACGEMLCALGRLRDAEPYFRRVRKTRAAAPEVVQFYRELFADPSAAGQLMQVLVQARRASDSIEDKLALGNEMATLALEVMDSPDRAIEVWRSILREDGRSAEVVSALDGLYRKTGKWRALVELLKESVDEVPADDEHKEERVEKLLEIASIYRDRLNLDTMALTTLQQVVAVDPGHDPTLSLLAETYEANNRWNDLLAVYERRIVAAEAEGDTAKRRDLMLTVARVWLERLGNPQRAAEPLQRLLEIDAADGDARDLLAEVYESRRDYRALIALRREAIAHVEGDAAKEARLELARLTEGKLGDPAAAREAWQAVIEAHGDDEEALHALQRLAERDHEWEQVAGLLERRVALAEGDRTVELLAALGGVCSERLSDAARARDTWLRLLELDPKHDKAKRTLRDMYIDAQDWDGLQALYERVDALGELVEVLHGAADRLAEVAVRVELYRREATLCQEQLKEPERAQRALERMLSLEPDNFGVAGELVPIYREQRNWARLLDTYQTLLRGAEGADAQLAVVASIVDIARNELKSAALTYQWSARAYELRPSDPELRAAVESAAEQSDAWDGLSSLYQARAAAEDCDDRERLSLLERCAVIARDRLQRPEEALRLFRAVLAVDARHFEAMDALESIFRASQRWQDLAEVFEARLEVTESDEERLPVLRGLAKLQREALNDPQAQRATYERMLAIDAEDVNTLAHMSQVLRALQDAPALAENLQTRIDLLPAEHGERAELNLELARLSAGPLEDPDRAVTAYSEVLDLRPGHAEAIGELEALAVGDESRMVPIMRILAPHYAALDYKPQLATALQVLVDAEDDSEAQRNLRERLAGVLQALPARRADALRVRGELFVQRPGDWDARQAMLSLGRELDDIDSVAGFYQAALQALAALANEEGKDSRELTLLRRDLLLEVAPLLRDDLGQREAAEQVYRAVLELEDTHVAAFNALDSLLTARDAHAELVELYRRRADVVYNQKEQQELLGRIVGLCRDVLADADRAIATAEELLALVPEDLRVIRQLGEMYAHAGRYQELDELFGRWVELVDAVDERAVLRCRRAMLRMRFLEDAFGAVDLLGQVLQESPDHGEARGLLEQLLQHQEVCLQAASLLEPLYERAEAHAALLRIALVRRDVALAKDGRDDVVAQLLVAVELCGGPLNDPASALNHARDAVVVEPSRADARAAFVRLVEAQGAWEDLATTWEQLLGEERVNDAAVRVELLRGLAGIRPEHLQAPDAAVEAWDRLLSEEPEEAAIVREAYDALIELHAEGARPVARLERMRERVSLASGPAEEVSLRLELAEFEVAQGELEAATQTLRDVLELDNRNRAAFDALDALLLQRECWDQLDALLVERIKVDDGANPAVLWRRIAVIRRAQRKQPLEAIAALGALLEAKAPREDNVWALAQQVELFRELERWPDAEDALRRSVALAENDAQRTPLLIAMAEVVGQHLGRGRDALDILKRILDASPSEANARAGVRAQLDDEATRDRAIGILTPLYERDEDWSALAGLEELQARHQPSGRRRLLALLKVAKTHEQKLSDVHRAFEVFRAALVEGVDQPELGVVLDDLERLGQLPEHFEPLCESLEAQVDHVLEASLQQRVLRTIGALALRRLNSAERAREPFERLLTAVPGDADAVEALTEIYERVSDPAAAVELLLQRSLWAEGAEVRDELVIEAAKRQFAVLEDPEAALESLLGIDEERQRTPEVAAMLEQLFTVTERFYDLSQLLESRLRLLSGAALVDAHLRLGELYGAQLDDPDRAISHLGEAIRHDPSQATGADRVRVYLEDPTLRQRAAEILEPVYTSVQDWPQLVALQEVRLEDAHDPEVRREILARIARIQEEQLEDLDSAFDSFSRLFREQPRDESLRSELERLASILGRSDEYAQVLTEFVEGDGADDTSEQALQIVREAASLWAGPLRQPAKATALLRRLLEADPGDRVAFSALEDALTGANAWDELIGLYWDAADNEGDAEKQLKTLQKLSDIALRRAEDVDQAVAAHRRALEIDSTSQTHRQRLERVLEENERWRDLVEALRDRVHLSEDPHRRTQLRLRVSELQQSKLESIEDAIDTLEALLGDDPDSAEGVESLLRIARAHEESRSRVLPLLRPVMEAAGDSSRCIELCRLELPVTEDQERRLELYLEIADRRATAQGRRDLAFATLCEALPEPASESTLERLDRQLLELSRELHNAKELATALTESARAPSLADEAPRRVALRVWAGELWSTVADDLPQARDVLTAALADDERHSGALEQLDGVLLRLGDADALAKVLPRRIELEEDDRAGVELQRRLGTLLEDTLSDTAAAKDAWVALLDLDPSDVEALTRLSRIYAGDESWDGLCDALERRVELSTDDAERLELRMQWAAVLREAKADREAEIEVLRTTLMDAPQHMPAHELLCAALLHEERWGEATEALEERANQSRPEEAVERLLESAQIHRRKLDDTAAALERLRSALAVNATHGGVLEALRDMATDADAWEQATELAAQGLKDAGQLDALVAVLEARVRFSEDPFAQVQNLEALADLQLQRGDHAAALKAWERVLDLSEDPVTDERVLEAAAKVAVASGATEAWAEALGTRVADEDREGSLRVLMGRSAAWLNSEVLQQPAGAVAAVAPLLAAELLEPEALTAVEGWARSANDRESLKQVLIQLAATSTDPADRAGAWARLGDVQREESADAAIESYREALTAEPGFSAAVAGLEGVLASGSTSVDALDALDEHYTASDDALGIARVTHARIHRGEEGQGDVALWERLASALTRGAQSPGDALAAWGRVLGLDPHHGAALREMLSVASTCGLEEACAELLGGVIADSDDERVEERIALARLQLSSLGRADAAQQSLEPVLSEHAERPEVHEVYAAAVAALPDPGQRNVAYRKIAEATQDANAAAGLWRSAAQEAVRAEDSIAACAALEQWLAQDPDADEPWHELLRLRRAQQGPELRDVLERRIPVAQDVDERVALRHELAQLVVHDDADAAIDTYNDLLMDRPDDLAALESVAAIHEAAGRFADVRDTLERQLDLLDDPARRAAVMWRMAELNAGPLEDRHAAADRLQELLAEQPGHAEADQRLEQLLRKDERWIDVSEVLRARAGRLRDSGDSDAYRDAASALAEVLAGPLEDVDGAQGVLDELLAVDPTHVPSLLALATLQEQRGESEAAHESLERAAAQQPTGVQGAALQRRLAPLSDNDRARREHYAAALELDPDDVESADALITLARSEERGGDLAALLLAGADQSARPTDERRGLRVEAADQFGSLGVHSEAMTVLHALYTEDQTDIGVNRRIADTLYAMGRYDESAGMYHWLVDVGRSAPRADRMLAHDLTRLADVGERTGHGDEVISLLEEAQRVDPGNATTLQVLGEKYMAAERWNDLLRIFRALLLQGKKAGNVRRGDVYLGLARAHLGLSEDGKAAAMVRRGLEEDGDHAGLRGLHESIT